MSQQNGLIAPSLRSRLRRRVGGYSPLLRWYRRFRPRWLWKLTSPLGAATLRYVDEFGLLVRHGPFIGMTFPRAAVGASGFLPAKLLGCYEAEVLAALDALGEPDTFVDIGSGDGYYPVAVGRRHPNAKVVGFETDGRERGLASGLAAQNGVAIALHGTATPAELNSALPDGGRLLILCDVEGAEQHLLEPVAVPGLVRASMVIELHPRIVPGIEETLTARFRDTHTVRTIQGKDRSLDLPELRNWTAEEANLAVTDGREHHGLWMVLEPIVQ